MVAGGTVAVEIATPETALAVPVGVVTVIVDKLTNGLIFKNCGLFADTVHSILA